MADSVDTDIKAKAKTPPSINTGSFVSLGSGKKGRVDMVVTSGKVPGVDDDVEGSASSPAARVVEWEQDGGKWKATGRKFGAMVNTLKRIPPLTFGKKDTPAASLVTMLAEHAAAIGDGTLPESAWVSAYAVKTVFDRGLEAWPGTDVTLLSRDQWAVGRVKAFLSVAAGHEVKGYNRDRDMLVPVDVETKTDPEPERIQIPADELRRPST